MPLRRVAGGRRPRRRWPQRGIVVRPRPLVRRLARVSPEIKYQLVQLNASVGTGGGAGAIFNAFIPAQGTSAVTRIGDRCRCVGVDISIDILGNTLATLATGIVEANAVRIIVGYSSNQAYANAVSASPFEGDYFDALSVTDHFSGLKDINTDIVTLLDKVYCENTCGTQFVRSELAKAKLKCSVPLKFAPGTTVVMQGSVFVYLVSKASSAFATMGTMDCRGTIKFRFTDD